MKGNRKLKTELRQGFVRRVVNGKWEAFCEAKRNLFTVQRSLLTIFSLLFTLYSLLLASPCFASMPWSNKPLPRINPQSKISYVNINWWDNFSDPYLKCYIIKAIENNHDAKRASWKVQEYKQQVKMQFSKELPSLSVGTDYIGNHLPDNFITTKSSIFTVPFLASYEADVFLKNHDKTKSSKKTYEVSQYQEMSTYISLAADVATTYINIVKFDKQIQLQQCIVETRREELRRQINSYKNGVVSVPDLNGYRMNYESAKSNLDETIKMRDKALNQLAVLIDECPENAHALKRICWDDLNYTAQIPCDISSDVVFSRPDIMAAEANLEKSKIDIKVARKEFLPTFRLNGIYAMSNIGSSGFGTWNSTIAAIVAGATMDLFKGGYKVANLKANKAIYEQMFEAYRQTDLNALKEVNDSLLIIREDTKIDKNTSKNLVTQGDTYKRAQESYQNGVNSCITLLQEREKILTEEQNKTESKAALLTDYITLYKAVGGKL